MEYKDKIFNSVPLWMLACNQLFNFYRASILPLINSVYGKGKGFTHLSKVQDIWVICFCCEIWMPLEVLTKIPYSQLIIILASGNQQQEHVDPWRSFRNCYHQSSCGYASQQLPPKPARIFLSFPNSHPLSGNSFSKICNPSEQLQSKIHLNIPTL